MTAAETRAATLAKLREHPGFAEVWDFWASYRHATNFATARQTVEALVCIAYAIGCGHGLDRAEAVILKSTGRQPEGSAR